MDVTGIIFAAIDCDADVIEAWNRWYDLQHLPPNVALAGVMSGRRYVATPDLHEARRPAVPTVGFADGQGTHVTIYTSSSDPATVIAAMAARRDRLEAEGRMFPAHKKAVRFGDAMGWVWGVADPALGVAPADVPHVAHTAIRVVLRRTGDPATRDIVAPAAVSVAGVHAVLGYEAVFQAGVSCDLYLLEGAAVEVTAAVRGAAPYPGDVEVLLDAPFRAIAAFDYGFAEEIRASSLPQAV